MGPSDPGGMEGSIYSLGRRAFFFSFVPALFLSILTSLFLPSFFFVLFYSCCSHARVFGKTLGTSSTFFTLPDLHDQNKRELRTRDAGAERLPEPVPAGRRLRGERASDPDAPQPAPHHLHPHLQGHTAHGVPCSFRGRKVRSVHEVVEHCSY